MADLDEIWRRHEAKQKAETPKAKPAPAKTSEPAPSPAAPASPSRFAGSGRPTRRAGRTEGIKSDKIKALSHAPLEALVVYEDGAYRLRIAGDAGYKGLSQPKLPRALIAYVQDKWSREAELSPAQMNSLSIQNMMLFLLIREVDDARARDTLVQLYDHPERQTLRQMMDASAGLREKKTDHELLRELVEQGERQTTELGYIRNAQTYQSSLFSRLLGGLLRAVSWLFLDRAGLFRTSLPKTQDDVRAILHSDDVVRLGDVFYEAGRDAEKRAETRRRTQMERTQTRDDS